MSRSGYYEYHENWQLIRWRGAVASAIRGKRGQAFLREMLAALDAMPEKRLVSSELEMHGSVCAIGAVGRARGLDMSGIDPENTECVAGEFGISDAMAREIFYENDEAGPWKQSDEDRFQRMRRWVESHIIDERSDNNA